MSFKKKSPGSILPGINDKSFVQRKEIEKLFEQLQKKNNSLKQINLNSIKLIRKQNERLDRVNKKVAELRKELISAWSNTLIDKS